MSPAPFIRRGFLSAPLAAALPAVQAVPPSSIEDRFADPGQSLPLTAARAGAKVRLFEAHGALGGVWTSSLLGYLLDFDKPGFNQELVRRGGGGKPDRTARRAVERGEAGVGVGASFRDTTVNSTKPRVHDEMKPRMVPGNDPCGLAPPVKELGCLDWDRAGASPPVRLPHRSGSSSRTRLNCAFPPRKAAGARGAPRSSAQRGDISSPQRDIKMAIQLANSLEE